MSQKTFTLTAGAIFSLVTLLHALRLLLGWEAVIGGWQVPLWVSWVGIAVAGSLGYTAFTLGKSERCQAPRDTAALR